MSSKLGIGVALVILTLALILVSLSPPAPVAKSTLSVPVDIATDYHSPVRDYSSPIAAGPRIVQDEPEAYWLQPWFLTLGASLGVGCFLVILWLKRSGWVD
jgi:hypothetical protein